MNAGAGDGICTFKQRNLIHTSEMVLSAASRRSAERTASRNGIATGSDVPLLRTTREHCRPCVESPISRTLSRGPRRCCRTPADSIAAPGIPVVAPVSSHARGGDSDRPRVGFYSTHPRRCADSSVRPGLHQK
ncbi:MAG: hypothetical protein QOK45_814 [Mycobacterium sp.]|jgi:hypothetical protein|nr:hypothetical protein [Mycobacterium sp.]